MRGNKKRVIAAVAVVCALAAGGAAFTYSNQLPTTNTAGYGNISVSGADMSDIQNTLSTDGQYITEVTLTFASAIPSNANVEVGWGPTSGTPPTNLNQTCTVAADHLSATCGDGTTNLQQVTTANEFAIAVYH
jgi:hypothetical protein